MNLKLEKLLLDLKHSSPNVNSIKAEIEKLQGDYPLFSAMGGRKIAFVGGPGAQPGDKEKMNRISAKVSSQMKDLERRLALAKKEEEKIRAQAALSIGKLRIPTTVEPLILALKDEYSSVRRNAAVALENIGDRKAILPLTELTKNDSDKNVLEAATRALKMVQKVDRSSDFAAHDDIERESSTKRKLNNKEEKAQIVTAQEMENTEFIRANISRGHGWIFGVLPFIGLIAIVIYLSKGFRRMAFQAFAVPAINIIAIVLLISFTVSQEANLGGYLILFWLIELGLPILSTLVLREMNWPRELEKEAHFVGNRHN